MGTINAFPITTKKTTELDLESGPVARTSRVEIVTDPAGTPESVQVAIEDFLAQIARPMQARLTLESGVPISTTDQLAKTTVYLTMFRGDLIALWDGTRWGLHDLAAQISVAVPANTSTPFDVFVYDNGGVLTLEALPWTNDTTRATALALQDGIYVKSGTPARRYIGTGRTTGSSGQCEDSTKKRLLWNYYNRIKRNFLAVEPTNTWTYTTATWREANGAAVAGVSRVEVVVGVAEDLCEAEVFCASSNATASITRAVGVGIDSTTVNSAQVFGNPGQGEAGGLNSYPTNCKYSGILAAGFHFVQWLEISVASGACTWYGDNNTTVMQSGLLGTIFG